MPVADASFTWQEATAAFAIIAVVAFVLSWVLTDLFGVARAVYVAALAATVLTLGAGYVAWSGTSVDDLTSARLGWGIAAGLVAAAITVPMVRRLPHASAPAGLRGAELFVWEDLVYGTAEALLLASLPVLALWQAAEAAGWTGSDRGKVGSGALAIAGALLVILVHHLGYAEFRAPAARPKLLGALVTVGVQAVAFLLTGSILAPIVAHVVLHAQMTFQGVELPPAGSRALPQD
jgi:hypothetical protein